MHILIDASRANNEQKTGVEWYAYFVIEELKKIIPPDVSVTLFTREKLRGDLACLPANWTEKVLAWPPRRLWTQIRLSLETLKNRRNPNSILFVPAHVLPLFTPKKTFTTIHDLGGFSFPKGYSWFERWYTKFAIKIAFKKAKIFVPSLFIKKEIEYFFNKSAASDKIKIVSNGYDNKLFYQIYDVEKIKTVLEKYQIIRPYFLSISRLEEKKNTVGIIKAFEIFCEQKQPTSPNYSLVLLGKPGFGFDKVGECIKNSKYKERIKIPGWVETADVPYLMAGAASFVYPSFYEGFGIPVLEAFAMGLPVVTSAVSSLPEVCGGAALLVNPAKLQEIAGAMMEIETNEPLRQDLVARGLKQAAEFSWKKTAQEIYLSLVKSFKL